ncbi:MAG: amino acid-binding protein [Planctomycetota bacterium]|nr:amino acid-binding protein [Planctomycetota bacterium]
MSMQVSRVDVWAGQMKDTPGALAGKLAKLADAGVNLEFVLARRRPEKKGSGVTFIAPIRGARQSAAARKAGFAKSARLAAVRVVGPDKAGMGAKITAALGEAGINLRGLSGAVIGKKFLAYLALDSAADAAKAARIIKKM